MDLSGATDAELKTELLSRVPTVSPGGIVHQVRYAVLTYTFGLGNERDAVTPAFSTDISNRRQMDGLTIAKEAIEKL